MTDADLRLKKGIKLYLVLFLSAFTFYFLLYYLVNKNSSTRFISFYSVLAGFTVLNTVLLKDFINNYSKTLIKLLSAVISGFLILFLLYLFADNFFRINLIADLRSYRKWIFAGYFCLSVVLFMNYMLKIYQEWKSEKSASSSVSDQAVFKASIFYSAAVLLVYSPVTVFLTSPTDFHVSVFSLLGTGIISAAAVYAAGFFFYRYVPSFFKNTLLYSSVCVSLIIFFNTFILPGQYGSLNNLILSDAEKLYGSVYPYGREFIILVFLFAASVFLIKKGKMKTTSVLLLINIVAFAQTGIGLVNYAGSPSHPETENMSDEKGFLPSYNDELMSFSKEGQNIVVLFLDMFSGGYVKDIFTERPDLKEVYDGFTWYPNTLSISYVTSSSVTAMLGGWEHTPDMINSYNDKRPLSDVIGDTYKILPRLLDKHGYKTSYLDPEYCYTYRGDVERLKEDGITAGFNKDYIGYWKNKNRDTDNEVMKHGGKLFEIKLLAMISLFKATPAVARPVIYNNGDWLVVSSDEKTNSAYRSKLEYWSFFDSLPEISNTDSSENTFKFLHTSLTHDPFSLSGEGKLIKGYPDASAGDNFHGKNAYLSAKGALVSLAQWIDWLKENGIYDNTKIIIATDHGDDFSKSPMMRDGFTVEGLTDEDFTRLHVALLIKDFGSRGEVKEDWRFMSNADLPSIITSDFSDIDDFGPDPTKTDNPEKRVLKTMKADSWRWHYVSNHDKFGFEFFYEVENSLFDDKNWSKK